MNDRTLRTASTLEEALIGHSVIVRVIKSLDMRPKASLHGLGAHHPGGSPPVLCNQAIMIWPSSPVTKIVAKA